MFFVWLHFYLLFIVGDFPYPHITSLADLLNFLESGHRLESPSDTPQEMLVQLSLCNNEINDLYHIFNLKPFKYM